MISLILLAYVGWCVLLYTQQTRIMFPRDLTSAPTPDAGVPRHVERVWIGDGEETPRVEAWFVPAAINDGERAPAVMLTHGNAELIDECMGDAARWTARGYHVLLCEYRGYGRSEGTPSQKGIVEDMHRFYDLLASRPEVDASRIVVHGRSLGAAVAAQIAGSRPVMGVVLESPFKSATSFAAKFGAPPFLVRSPFRTDRVLRTLKAPVLILHSVDDEIIPVSHARALKRIHPRAMLVELTGGHNSGLSNQPKYWQAVDEWLADPE